MEALGLRAEDVSTQVVPRDRHAKLLSAIALAGAGLERFATEVRNLQRTEVREVEEPFGAGQKGSSAMPHKRNPIIAERLCGLARVLRGYAQTGLENVALWHERDISHSGAERVVLPDATILLDYMQRLAPRLVDGMTVDADRMLANLELTHGALFSQRALTALVEAGHEPRRRLPGGPGGGAAAWDDGIPFRELIAAEATDLTSTRSSTTTPSCATSPRFSSASRRFARLTGMAMTLYTCGAKTHLAGVGPIGHPCGRAGKALERRYTYDVKVVGGFKNVPWTWRNSPRPCRGRETERQEGRPDSRPRRRRSGRRVGDDRRLGERAPRRQVARAQAEGLTATRGRAALRSRRITGVPRFGEKVMLRRAMRSGRR